jgi:putative ABC transport system permease protein
MSRLHFYVHYALRSLRRDSTRTFLAGLSVTFGVLSLVAMQLLANTLLHGVMFDQQVQYGGDAQIQPEQGGQGFKTADLTRIEQWHQDGLIADYTPVSFGSARYLRTSTNGRVTFLAFAMGIDPNTYPLIGNLVLREPVGAQAADVLRQTNDALITRDLADKLGLKLGDSILLSGDSTPFTLTIVGIVGATPAQSGDSVLYSLATAKLIENREDVINAISVKWGTVTNAEQTVVDSPYRVYVASSRDDAVSSSTGIALFDMMLKGAGVLGLLVGGLSVSNTLQVILARRKLEIAMLKTLGYRQSDLMVLIGLETGIIGLLGGMTGALSGSLIAGKLIDTLSISGSLMVDWHPDSLIVIGGVIVGILTAVVFGLQAMLASSATRPIQLLRDLPLQTSRRTQIERFGLFAMMLLIFGLLVGAVLGTPLQGILYVFGGSVILVVLRSLFWSVLWVVLKLPIPRFPMLRLARANLRQRKTQASLVILALFAGAFSVTFAALAIYNAQSTVSRTRGSDAGYNLMVYASVEDQDVVLQRMIVQGAQDTFITQRIDGLLNGKSVILEARDAAALNKDMHFDGLWDNAANGVLLPEALNQSYAIDEQLILVVNGRQQTAKVAGFYQPGANSMTLEEPPIIVSSRLLQEFRTRLQVRVMGMFPVSALSDVTHTLGQSLPNVLVFSRADLNDAMNTTFQSLFTFAASIAGLAFVAGAVLIANATGLTVVERRLEMGMFKAVGYTSGHILRILLSEYGFLGTLAGVFGVLGSVICVSLINIAQPGARLVITPTILVGMLLFSAAIAVISAALVAWQPTRVRPLYILRYE